VKPLNAAKNKVLSTSNVRRRGTVQKVDHMWPNLRLGKPHFGKSCDVDLVGACIYATKGRSRNINLWGTYLRYSDCQQILYWPYLINS
jgi:hypothetical protein